MNASAPDLTPVTTPIELRAGGNEASDLLRVRSPELLAARGWRRAFWTVLDEAPVEKSLALLGLPAGEPDTGAWQAMAVAADAGPQTGRTEDGEALAHRDGWVYVIGSHFGSKRGPLRPRRAFVARFREADAATAPVRLQVARNAFRLHRAVNEAFAATAIDVIAPGDGIRDRYLRQTMVRGHRRAKDWVHHLADGDSPVNVEAAAFTAAGTLLLGLRYPVTSVGAPLLVELADVADLFDADPVTLPRIVAVRPVPAAATPGRLTGFRALSARDDGTFDAVVGSIDATGKRSVVLADHPHGADVTCRHVRLSVPPAGADAAVGVEPVRDFPDLYNVEGVSEADGRIHYVTDDEDRIRLWLG